MIVNELRYVQNGVRGKSSTFLIKERVGNINQKECGIIYIKDVRFPKHLIGKRVKLKVEFIDDNDKHYDDKYN